jgi:ATP-dependent Clp protease protease subunit
MNPGIPLMPSVPVPETVYIVFSAEITPMTSESLLALIFQQVNIGVKHVYLILTTQGGSVMHGVNLYNVLRGLPIKVTTHNGGQVNSIGNAIFLAGNPRYTCAHASFMFHGVGFDVPQAARFEEKVLRERLDSVLNDQKRIGSIIQERTKIDSAEIEGLFREAQTKDATFARDKGIVDEIRDIQIPAGAPVFTLVFQR